MTRRRRQQPEEDLRTMVVALVAWLALIVLISTLSAHYNWN